MATTIKQIAQYIDNLHWQYQVDEDTSSIVTGVSAKNIENFKIVIHLQEDGQFLKLYTPQLFVGVQEHEHRELIFRTLLALTWDTKMLQWERDLIDGEVRAVIEFPLEDAPLTEKQFNRCLSSLVRLVDEVAMPRLQQVMATGKDPVETELGEQMVLMLQEIVPGGVLNVLGSALANRQSPKGLVST